MKSRDELARVWFRKGDSDLHAALLAVLPDHPGHVD